MTFCLDHKFALTHNGITHDVYVDGDGPAVVLMHELPGMTPGCLRVAEQIREAGFRVYLPLFFGKPYTDSMTTGLINTVFCVRREFNIFASHGKSSIADWLKELCRMADSECGDRGVGLIGMCLSGNVVLSVMVDRSVRVPVMCEPALPFLHKAALGVPQTDIDSAVKRAAEAPILAFRFVTDTICPKEKFDTLRGTFGDNVHTTEIPTGPDHPFNLPKSAHSVISGEYPNVCNPDHPVQQSINTILSQFKSRLN